MKTFEAKVIISQDFPGDPHCIDVSNGVHIYRYTSDHDLDDDAFDAIGKAIASLYRNGIRLRDDSGSGINARARWE